MVKLLVGGGGEPCAGPAALLQYKYSLTGPIGQPLASRLVGQQFASQKCTHT